MLLLGGADFLGLRLTASTVFTMLHVVGVFLAAWGTWLAARRFLRDRDLVAQLLVTGVVINLAAYVLSTKAGVVTQTREIAFVLPFSAALAGRLLAVLAGRLKAAKLVPLLLVVLLGYLAGLAARSASRRWPRRTSSSPPGWRPGTCTPACPATGSRMSSR